ncbi:MAG: amidohydrolase family protein [Cyclobacteriaceae bacterium]|nr:amidohydrolase family protein [Cyclobacteriaceae bacterium]
MKKPFLLLLLALGSIAARTQTPDTTIYSVVNGGKLVGSEQMLVWPNHRYQYNYEFNDRGRGPKMSVELTTDVTGVITRRIATGIDYFKAPVLDEWQLADGTAKWKNRIESESKQVAGPVIYSPISSTPAETSLWIKLLIKQPNHQVAVMPSGTVQARHIKNHVGTVEGSIPVELELYAIAGLGGPPSYCWVTPRKEFFAAVNGWTTVILKGHEKMIDELKAIQDEIEHDYFEEAAEKLTHRAKAPYAIEDVSVFDPFKGKIVPHQTVMIEQGRIAEVGKSSRIKLPAGIERIDGKGKTLMAGLWDNHSHYSPEQGLFHLAGGVTNVKDMGNSLDLPEVKKKVDEGELLGPEISIMSGFIDFAGPYAGPTGKIVKTLDEGIAAVRYYKEHGYQQVKLYSSIPVEWVKPLAEEAHRQGLKVCGHIPSFMTAERAVKDGYDQIIHINMVMLNFLGDTLDTRSMGRFVKVAERAGGINVNSQAVRNFVSLLKERKVVVDPTAGVFEDMFVNQAGQLANGYGAVKDFFPSEYRRQLYYGGLPGIATNGATYKSSFENMLRMIKQLYAGGVTLVPGTDGFPGFLLHRELELYAQAGIPQVDILRAATLTSAKVAGVDNELGSVTKGKRANLVLINGNPLANPADIRKIALTIKGGHRFDPRALYASFGFGYWP